MHEIILQKMDVKMKMNLSRGIVYILLSIGLFSNIAYAGKIKHSDDHYKYADKISWSDQQSYFCLEYDNVNDLVWALPIAYVDEAKLTEYVKPALTYKSYPSSQIQKVMIPTILDSMKNYETLYYFDKNEKIQFNDSKVIGTLDNYLVNGQISSWRFPEFSEVKRNNPFKYEQSSFIGIGGYASVIGIHTGNRFLRGIAVYTECSSNKKITSGNRPNLMECNGKFNKNLRYKSGHDIYDHPAIVVLVREPNEYDKIIFNTDLKPLEKLSELTALMTQEQLKVDEIKVVEELNYDLNIRFRYAKNLHLNNIAYSENETRLTTLSCDLYTGGPKSFTLNGEPFKYFLYDGKKYDYSNDKSHKVECSGGEAVYVFDRITENIFTFSRKKYINTSYIQTIEAKVNNYIFKPVKPLEIKPKSLTRGEFEKTADFEKKKEQEQKRVAALNQKQQEEYQLKIKELDRSVNLAQMEYDKQVAHNKKESTIKNTANEVVNRAVNMVFGDPRFKNLKYDADKEVFNATLYSTLNDFSMPVKISVPIDNAKKFKEKLLDKRLILSVDFKIVNDKLTFANVAAVTNEIKQKQDFKAAKEKNTIVAYKNYLEYHANAPQAKRARQAIADIKEQHRVRELNRKKEAEARAQRAEERRQQEIKAYMKTKHVGDQVCKSGFTALILPITIRAYVEKVNGDNMQLRISDTEGTSPHYNGVTLYKNTLIWDKYHEWKHCN